MEKIDGRLQEEETPSVTAKTDLSGEDLPF